MRALVTLIGALLGGFAGYMAGAYAGCDYLMRDSDLCGIYGALTGPIGMIVGGILAWRAAAPPRGAVGKDSRSKT